MKGYVKPEILEISDVMETVGLGSGPTPNGERVTLRWNNQDTGTHSDLWVGIPKPAGSATAKLVITLVDASRSVVDIQRNLPHNWVKSMTIADGGRSVVFTIEFGIAKEQADHFGFNIQLVFSPGPYAGATDPTKLREMQPGSVGGDGITSGSFAFPLDFNDTGLIRRGGIPYRDRDGGQSYDGCGNANQDWYIDYKCD